MSALCMTCVNFSYVDPDDLDECDGYCLAAYRFDPTAAYGHWVRHDECCHLWERDTEDAIAVRLTRRAEAVRTAEARKAERSARTLDSGDPR